MNNEIILKLLDNYYETLIDLYMVEHRLERIEKLDNEMREVKRQIGVVSNEINLGGK